MLICSLTMNYFKNDKFCERDLIKSSERIKQEGDELLVAIEHYSYQSDDIIQTSKPNLSIFVFTDNNIVYWNQNIIPPEFITNLKKTKDFRITKNPTGWYLYTSKSINDTTTYFLQQLKSDYIVNNNYLHKSSTISFCDNIHFSLKKSDKGININNSNGSFISNISIKSSVKNKSITNTSLLFLYVIILALILSIISINTVLAVIKRNFRFLFITVSGILVLTFFYWFIINHCTIFKINYVLVSLLFAVAISFSLSRSKLTTSIKANSDPLFIILFSIYFTLSSWLIYCFSLTGFETNVTLFLFDDFSTLTSISLITLINISLFLVIRTILNKKRKLQIPWYVSFLLITLIGFGNYFIIIPDILLASITVSFTLIVLLFYQVPKLYNRNNFLNQFIIILLLSVLTSIIINVASKIKAEETHKIIAQTLAVCNDEILEDNINEIYSEIINDSLITTGVFDTISTHENDNYISLYITDKYLANQQYRYDIQLTICRENELIEIQPEGEVYNCIEYFDGIIEDYSAHSIDSILFNVKTNTESLYYIFKIQLINPNNKFEKANIFIEYISSYIPEGLGYPELLIDSRANKLNLSGYSISNYSNSSLIYKFGDYDYTTTIPESFFTKRNTFFTENNFVHYSVKNSDGIYIIVSKPKTPISSYIFIFSITFLFFTVITILFYMLFRFRKVKNTFLQSFTTRLQVFIISTLTSSFIILAFFTLWYIDQNNIQTTENQLKERTNSVIIELQHKLDNVQNLNQTSPEILHNLLRKFSLVFFSDINLYNTEGRLIATSRPEIFDKYLQSDLINRNAYNAIFHENILHYITKEKIGNLSYFSSYSPLILDNSEPAGIINLPYFAKQSEINRSFFTMISYLINIYVIIGILGTILAITFSGYLTKPLRLLQQKMSKVRIDKQNEKFNWKRKDEIGILIDEYNKMVQKLEQSADLIKHNERESAWRENAQQIAHEIKNPLTPMQLNVQYLEKAYKNNDPDFGSKIESISKSLIIQIEVLNKVAEDFSNLAKSRKRKMKELDLKSIILTSVNTFDKRQNIEIITAFIPEHENFITHGFEKDILRVFNNLLKNAIQALSGNTDGKIKIVAIKDSKYIKITITDNGRGIPSEMKSKIFQPYFTTKSSGTGLGLAIVKTIMNECGGEIFFESETGKGTVFTLQFITT